MIKIKNKKFKRKINQSNFFSQIVKIIFPFFLTLSILTIIGFLIVSNFKINYKKNQLQSQIEILKKQVEKLEKRNQELKSNISESQTDFFVEKKIREDLGFKKPDEEVVVILPSLRESEKEIKIKKDFWQKFLDLLKLKQ